MHMGEVIDLEFSPSLSLTHTRRAHVVWFRYWSGYLSTPGPALACRPLILASRRNFGRGAKAAGRLTQAPNEKQSLLSCCSAPLCLSAHFPPHRAAQSAPGAPLHSERLPLTSVSLTHLRLQRSPGAGPPLHSGILERLRIKLLTFPTWRALVAFLKLVRRTAGFWVRALVRHQPRGCVCRVFQSTEGISFLLCKARNRWLPRSRNTAKHHCPAAEVLGTPFWRRK